MFYTLLTRARRHGIQFDHHELEPLGLSEGSKCWGMWVEGRAFDKMSRLDSEELTFQNESPQLGISAIHPDYWATAFNLEVLIQRRRTLDRDDPASSDAYLGLIDALVRCGVNILQIGTAQIGYDLICVSAVCEFPDLRAHAKELIKIADKAGQAMYKARREAVELNESEREAKLSAAEAVSFRTRVAAFQALGLLLVPRLADLEARLTMMHYRRHDYQKGSPEVQTGRVESALPGKSNRSISDAIYASAVGMQPSTTSPVEDLRNNLQSALRSPWYLNEKVSCAGENTYYLSYHSITGTSVSSIPWPEGVDQPTQIRDKHDLDENTAKALWNQYHAMLREIDLTDELEKVVPRSPSLESSGRRDFPRSGVAERMLEYANGQEFASASRREFFLRQALRPVRVSALPSLAHMRFWAFSDGGAEQQAIEFKYERQLLMPDGMTINHGARLQTVFDFLNVWTGVSSNPAEPDFRANMAVLANINLHDHFARIRFVREQYETRHYVQACVKYSVTPDGEQFRPNSQGLMRIVSQALIEMGFRIERAVTLTSATTKLFERGSVELIGRACSATGSQMCLALAQELQSGKVSTKTFAMKSRVNELLASASLKIEVLSIDLTTGFVPWNR